MLLLRRFLPPGMLSSSPPMPVLSGQGPFSSHLLWATFIHVRVPSTPGPCPESSGFSCSLSCCLYKSIGYFSQAQPTTHLTQPGDTPVPAPGCSISPGPQPQHLAANHPSMSTFMLRCGKPRILHKLRRASPYPNQPAGSSSGDPPLSRDHRLGSLCGTTGSACPSQSTSTCSSGLRLAASIPVLNADAVVGGISRCSDMNHKKGRDMLSHALPCYSGSPILLPSAHPLFLREADHSDSLGSSCSLQRHLKLTTDSTGGRNVCHGMSKLFRGHRPYNCTPHSVSETVEM